MSNIIYELVWSKGWVELLYFYNYNDCLVRIYIVE